MDQIFNEFKGKIEKLDFSELNLYNKNADGRLNSAISEDMVFDFIKKYIPEIKKAPPRYWYDCIYKEYPFNIKITTGTGADNISSKIGMLYAMTGYTPEKIRDMGYGNINIWNNFNQALKDLSTINPGIAAPARYIYTMAEDGALPKFLGKIHPKFKTPYVAVIVVGVINFILIATGSINYIASVSLISLAICYMIGCLSYMGLKKKYPDMKRPYKAPLGVIGCIFTIVVYCFMLIFADKAALITSGIITVLCVIFYFAYSHRKECVMPTIEEEIGVIEEPDEQTKVKMDRQYTIWKVCTIIVTCIALGIYIIPMVL